MGKNLLKVLKAENKPVCICARSTKPASEPVQVVDDGGTNRAPRKGKASAEKLRGSLKIREGAQVVPPWQPSCGAVLGAGGGLSHGRGLPEISSSKARSCGAACVWDEAMPGQPVSVPSCSCQPGAESGEDDMSCSQRGSGDVTGNLGEVVYNSLGQYSAWGRFSTTLQEEAIPRKSARSPSVGSRAMRWSWGSGTSKTVLPWHLSKSP